MGSPEFYQQWIMTLLAIVYLITMIWTIYLCCDGVKERFFVLSTYITGLLSRFVLLFSPTMIASGTRVYFYFYMAMIVCIIYLVDKLNNANIKRILYITLLFGVMMNITTIAIKG